MSTRPLRPLALKWIAGLTLLGLATLEAGVAVAYDAPTPMLDKAEEYNALPHGDHPELLILGTCLPEQIIQRELLEETLGGGTRAYNLATPAGTTRLMYLTLLHEIPDEAQVKAIVVPYGKRDLTKLMAPYESQVMELARWSDMAQLAEWACKGDRGCETELVLRKASRAYRYRGYLANWFWQSLRTKPPIPGYVLSPGAVAPPELDDAGLVGGDPSAGPDWQAKGDPNQGEPDLVYLEALLDLADERGMRMVFVPLPERSQLDGPRDPEPTEARYEATLKRTITAHGGELIDVYALPGLSHMDFEDEVHLNPRGRKTVTLAIGQALAHHFETP